MSQGDRQPTRQQRRRTIGLDPAEKAAVASAFGVAREQVERDHVISHLLAGISRSPVSRDLVFFAGTALTRTDLLDLRLSEDIDLIALKTRSTAAVQLAQVCESAMARTYGRVSWSPSLQATSGSEPASLVVADTTGVQIQLLSDAGCTFPTAVRCIDHRYSDVDDVSLRTLTTTGFVVAKLAAWSDRRTPRDLYDLWALADAGLFSADAIALYRQIGPTGARPRLSDYDEVPSALEWGTALSHQCRIRVNPQDAADVVRRSLRA